MAYNFIEMTLTYFIEYLQIVPFETVGRKT